MTFSTSRVAAVLLAGLMLAACDPASGRQSEAGSSPSPEPTAGSPKTDVTASPGTTTREGRTIRPVSPGDCAVPAIGEVRKHLGAVADQVQPPVPASVAAEGLTETTCTFSLAPAPAGQAPDPGNSLTVSTTVYAAPESLAKVPLPRLMMAPKAVEGLGDRAWFSTNTLSSTTEYVLEVVEGKAITRANLALPASAAKLDDAENRLAALVAAE